MVGSHASPAEPSDVTFASGDGTALRARFWAHADPRAIVVISHGLGEHGGSYRQVAEMLGPAGRADVLAFDYRGHGRSAGPRGVVRSYQDLERDLLAALDWAARARPNLPRFLLGHSNGGLVAAKVVAEGDRGLAGLILSNPALQLATRVPRWKKAVGRILTRIAPNATLSTGLREDGKTQDPIMREAMAADPLRHTRIGPTFFFGMIEAGIGVLGRAEAITLPTLMILGGGDPIIDPAASRAFFERLGSADKTLRFEPEMRHEPFSELGRELVVADVRAWVEARS